MIFPEHVFVGLAMLPQKQPDVSKIASRNSFGSVAIFAAIRRA